MRNKVPIIMYHWFRAPGSAPAHHSPQLEISPERFEEQMRYLKAEGYQTVSLQDLSISRTHTGDRKCVVITFDDGTADFCEYAKPILDSYGFKATLFIVTGFVGGRSDWELAWGGTVRPLLDWEQIVSLHREGFEIASHSHRHRRFTELNDKDVWQELITSRDVLANKLGAAPGVIAYPQGAYRTRQRRLVKQAGYESAYSVMLSWKDVFREDRYSRKRLTVKGTQTLDQFAARLEFASRCPLISTCSDGR